MNSACTPALRQRKLAGGMLPTLAAALCAVALLAPLPASAGATLQRIKQTGTLKIGYGVDGPYVAKAAGTSPEGFALDLCKGVIDGVKSELNLPGLKVDLVAVQPGDALDAVASGKVDVLCAGLVPTLAGRQRVSYSIPMFASGVGAVVRKDASNRLKDTLSGRAPPAAPLWRGNADRLLRDGSIAVIKGTRAETVVGQKLGKLNLVPRVVAVPDYAAGLDRVADGRSSVFFGERAVLLQAIRAGKLPRDLEVLDRYFSHESVAFAVPRDDEDLRLVVDAALSKQFRSDAFAGLYAKWFGPLGADARTLFLMNALPE